MEVHFEGNFHGFDTCYALCIRTSVGDQCVSTRLPERGVEPPEDMLEAMRQTLRNWLQVKTRIGHGRINKQEA